MGWYIQALPAFTFNLGSSYLQSRLFGCADPNLLAITIEAQKAFMRLVAICPILLYLAFVVAMFAWRQERRKLIKGIETSPDLKKQD
jgi:hypothetical protein